MSQTSVRLYSAKTGKFVLVHGIAAAIVIYILGMAIPSIGAVQFNLYTGIAVVLASGLAALMVAIMKQHIFFEAFVSGLVGIGGAYFLYMLMSQPVGSLLGVVFASNFLIALGTSYYKKGKLSKV